jgi:hypothetical protein
MANTDFPSLATPLVGTPEPPRPLTFDERIAQIEAEPTPAEVLSAGFRQNNLIASTAADKRSAMSLERDPEFNLRKSLEAEKNPLYLDNWQSFHNVFNQKDFDLTKAQIDMEQEDRRKIEAGGWLGVVGGVAGGILDPTLLLPVAGEVNGARSAANVGRAFLRTGLSVGAATAAQEAGLQATQTMRTGEESAFAIGSSVLLGGLLGSAAKVMSPAERQIGEAALQRLSTPEGSAVGSSAGAAARDVLSREDLTVAGNAAERVADSTAQMNPILRGNTSPSAAVRDASQSLFENTMYQAGNAEGRTAGIAAETAIRQLRDSLMPEGLTAHNAIFKEARLANVGMNAEEFESAVGMAMRRADTGENDFVSRAAESWRKTVFDPLKKEAIKLDLLPADVSVDEADSYFTRMWNSNKINAQQSRFVQIVRDHIEGGLRQEFQDDVERLQGRLAKLEREKTDLQLTPDLRAKEIEDIEAKQQQLYGNNPDHVDRADQLNDLRQQVAAANEAGKKELARNLQEAARNLRKAGGEGFTRFEGERATLNARRRNLDLGYASMADRRDTIMNSLADLEEANQRSMLRLVKKGQKFQQEIQRLDPATFAERAGALREAFAAEAAKAERQAERFKAQADKLEKVQAEGKSVGAAGADLLDRQAKAEQARADRLNAIASRMEAAENLDPQAMLDEVQDGVSNLISEVSNVSLGRGERAQRLQERLATLDPAKVDARLKAIEETKQKFNYRHMEKWDIERGAMGTHLPVGQQDFSQYSGDIANAIFDKLSGRGFDNNIPDGIVPATRGPLKERTFHIPDRLVEDFLESNVKHVAENYVRKMTADIELTRKFGSADMKEVLAKVQQDYDKVRAAVNSASSIDEIRQAAQNEPGLIKKLFGKGDGKKSIDQVREETLGYLRRREKSDLEDLQAGRDLMRGNYKPANMNTVWGRSVRAALQYNYLTRMGSVVISNLSEIFRPAMVYGLSPFLSDGITPLLSNLKSIGVQNAIKELKLAGVATERALLHRIQSLSEMGDPYARGTAAERLMDNATRVAGKWSGLAALTDFNKTVSGILAQDRIIRLAQEGKDVKTLSYLGMNAAMRERVADQVKRFASKEDGAWAANTEKWTDEEAVRHFRAALNKDVNSVIVTKSVGDVPLFANTPTGKIIMQFKAFALASHQRVLIRGLQEGGSRFMGGLISMTIMGMMATYFRALATNRLDKIPGADNPGWWIGEGLDNTGIFAVPLELANDLEKPTGINPLKDPLRAAGRAITGATDKPESFRNTNRNGPGALLGPTFGTAADVFNLVGTLGAHARGAKVSAGQNKSAVNSAANLTPFYSYPILRQVIDWGVKPAAADALGAKP